MKTIVILSAVLLVFTACRRDEVVCPPEEGEGDVVIQITNKTGQNLNSITVGGCYFPDLIEDETSCPERFETLPFDGCFPDVGCVAEVDGKEMESFNQFYFCGTEKYIVESGEYQMNIVLAEMDGEEYLKLEVE